MKRDVLADLAALRPTEGAEEPQTETEDEHYPGSKKRRRAVAGKPASKWDDLPSVTFNVAGVPTVFYEIGVLASMLDRRPPTVRKWEALGYLPPSRFRSPGRGKHGQKRLYTREMIEGVVRIARQEGLIGGATTRNVGATRFPARVEELFHEMGVIA